MASTDREKHRFVVGVDFGTTWALSIYDLLHIMSSSNALWMSRSDLLLYALPTRPVLKTQNWSEPGQAVARPSQQIKFPRWSAMIRRMEP